MDLQSRRFPPDVVAAQTAAIRNAILGESRHIHRPNFEQIGTEDLASMFALYDLQFFEGWLGQTVKAQADSPLLFRLSSTMTRAGGKTIRYRSRCPGGGCRFEIAIASQMLFMNFGDVSRPVTVCGLTCQDRLETLQRIMEHEIIHLAELLVWQRSSCSARRFKSLAANIFGHTDARHALVTVHERAAVQHGVCVGGMVEFDFEGQHLVGRVNRIHRRATVLVQSADGRKYSDGLRYSKFYVPLERLRPVQAEGNQGG